MRHRKKERKGENESKRNIYGLIVKKYSDTGKRRKALTKTKYIQTI